MTDELISPVEATTLDVSIVGARIVEPKIVNGHIVDGRIVGGRVVDVHGVGQRALHALHIDAEHRHTEVVAILGLGLALLLAFVL